MERENDRFVFREKRIKILVTACTLPDADALRAVLD